MRSVWLVMIGCLVGHSGGLHGSSPGGSTNPFVGPGGETITTAAPSAELIRRLQGSPGLLPTTPSSPARRPQGADVTAVNHPETVTLDPRLSRKLNEQEATYLTLQCSEKNAKKKAERLQKKKRELFWTRVGYAGIGLVAFGAGCFLCQGGSTTTSSSSNGTTSTTSSRIPMPSLRETFSFVGSAFGFWSISKAVVRKTGVWELFFGTSYQQHKRTNDEMEEDGNAVKLSSEREDVTYGEERGQCFQVKEQRKKLQAAVDKLEDRVSALGVELALRDDIVKQLAEECATIRETLATLLKERARSSEPYSDLLGES